MKEKLYDLFNQTSLDYYTNGNALFSCKQYKIQYISKLKKWKCNCKGYLRSGGKNVCKHVKACALKQSLETSEHP